MFYQRFEYLGFENFRNRKSVVEKFLKTVIYVFLVRLLLKLVLPFLGFEGFQEIETNLFSLCSNFQNVLENPWTILTYIFMEKSVLDFIIDIMMIKVLSKIFLMQSTERKYIGLIVISTIGSAAIMILGFFALPKLKNIVQFGIGLDCVTYGLIGAIAAMVPSFPLSILFFLRIKVSHIIWLAILNALYKLDYKSSQALLQLSGIIIGYIYGYLIQSGELNIFSKTKVRRVN